MAASLALRISFPYNTSAVIITCGGRSQAITLISGPSNPRARSDPPAGHDDYIRIEPESNKPDHNQHPPAVNYFYKDFV
jgi:hypothetical protein